MFLHQAHQQERLQLAEQHALTLEQALAEVKDQADRRLKHELTTRVSLEVQRIDREKSDRADSKLRLENDRLRKQLEGQRESIEYLERLLEKMQATHAEGSEECRELRRKVKKLEYVLYGKKKQQMIQ